MVVELFVSDADEVVVSIVTGSVDIDRVVVVEDRNVVVDCEVVEDREVVDGTAAISDEGEEVASWSAKTIAKTKE